MICWKLDGFVICRPLLATGSRGATPRSRNSCDRPCCRGFGIWRIPYLGSIFQGFRANSKSTVYRSYCMRYCSLFHWQSALRHLLCSEIDLETIQNKQLSNLIVFLLLVRGFVSVINPAACYACSFPMTTRMLPLDLGMDVRKAYHQARVLPAPHRADASWPSSVLVAYHMVMALICEWMFQDLQFWRGRAPKYYDSCLQCHADSVEMLGSDSLGDLSLLGVVPVVGDIFAEQRVVEQELGALADHLACLWSQKAAREAARFERAMAGIVKAIEALDRNHFLLEKTTCLINHVISCHSEGMLLTSTSRYQILAISGAPPSSWSAAASSGASSIRAQWMDDVANGRWSLGDFSAPWGHTCAALYIFDFFWERAALLKSCSAARGFDCLVGFWALILMRIDGACQALGYCSHSSKVWFLNVFEVHWPLAERVLYDKESVSVWFLFCFAQCRQGSLHSSAGGFRGRCPPVDDSWTSLVRVDSL